LTRSTLGFGDALIAMPLLAFTIEIKTATPLVALVSLVIGISILLKSWRDVDLESVRRLILASLLGIPFGLFLLTNAPETTVKGILGILLILFGLYNLLSPELPRVERKELAYVAGYIAGVLGGAYNTNGPPVIIYGTLCRWSPARFRASLQGFFLSSIFAVLGHGLAGLWTPRVLQLFASSLPVVVVAILMGERLNRLIPAGRFDRYIHMALIVMGVLLLA
jgi:uncharacterized membrane protein YfcA